MHLRQVGNPDRGSREHTQESRPGSSARSDRLRSGHSGLLTSSRRCRTEHLPNVPQVAGVPQAEGSAPQRVSPQASEQLVEQAEVEPSHSPGALELELDPYLCMRWVLNMRCRKERCLRTPRSRETERFPPTQLCALRLP